MEVYQAEYDEVRREERDVARRLVEAVREAEDERQSRLLVKVIRSAALEHTPASFLDESLLVAPAGSPDHVKSALTALKALL